ncbi:hypothetical protein ACF090_33605 [Streptomyces sp. NPDC014892]|uniref:hypothetical protein n=1 Tax=Streptomyces sp. NPDC014892 TaxID=3364930 RepID=UPI0036FA4979
MYDAIERENAERILHRLRVTELQEARDEAYRAWVKTAGYAKREERRPYRQAFLEANKALREGRRGLRKVTSPATMHRINDTLSSALTWGIKREQAFAKNWSQLVELPSVTRPKPIVWTPERVEHWKRTGEKPGPVMVWTPKLTAEFLDFVKDDWLYDLWHSFIFLGPRRGEMPAVPWTEVSIDALWLRISQQIVEVAYQLVRRGAEGRERPYRVAEPGVRRQPGELSHEAGTEAPGVGSCLRRDRSRMDPRERRGTAP